MKRTVTFLAALTVLGCTSASLATTPTVAATLEEEPSSPLDCDREVADRYPAACPVVRRASDYAGRCVPAEDFAEWGCLLADSDVELCRGGGTFDVTVLLDQDGVRVDCAGQTIRHAGAEAHPGVRAPKDRSLRDVTIAGCTIAGTGHAAVELMRYFRGDELNDRLRGHRDVRVEDVEVSDAKFGVYVGAYSRGVVLERVRVHGAHEVGVYVDASSEDTRVMDSVVEDTRRREGIAIDSSTGTQVLRTLTRGNHGAGIRLFHNCGELRGTVCPIIRPRGASFNLVAESRIEDGIIVGSRQGHAYESGWCATLGGRAGSAPDEARGNVIRDNVFVAPERWAAVAIHTPGNRVIGNTFAPGQTSDSCLAVHLEPVAFRGRLLPGANLRGTEVIGNQLAPGCRLQLRHGTPRELTVRGNRSEGGCIQSLGNTCGDGAN